MSRIELERPLQAEALEEIERSLHARLKAHRLSDSFIARHAEEAIQRGVVEYLRALEDEREIDNRDAFVVKAAFCRAIDALRREARQLDGSAVEALLESGHACTPASEELAIEHLSAEELHEAIDALGAEERQALTLRYFEQLSDQRSAEAMYCSERTFRRRVAKALDKLSRRLGVPTPKPDSGFAIEIGVAAWVSLRGASVAPSHGLLATAANSAQDCALWAIDRVRDLIARPLISGTSERIAVVASGPAGKAGGACGALALCVLTGVVGPGVGGIDVIDSHHSPQGQGVARNPSNRGEIIPPESTETPPAVAEAPSSSSPKAHTQPTARSTAAAGRKRREARQVRTQADGLARAGGESTAAPAPAPPPVSAASTTEPTEASVPPSGNSSATSHTTEETQAKQQFGAFK